MAFVFGAKSENNLKKVHPDLVRVMRRALKISPIDFSIIEGARTIDRQRQLVASGASQTMKSNHLIQQDGFVYAVDIAPYVGGNIRWDWPLYYNLAEAVKKAAKVEGVPIIWGGVWDKRINALSSIEKEVELYGQRRRLAGKKPFLDGPHFELDRKAYP